MRNSKIKVVFEAIIAISIVNYCVLGHLPGEMPADIVEYDVVNYLDVSSLVSHYGESY
jgi:hypothetical protein